VRRIARPAVYRASAIGADLAHLAPDWDASLPALPAATRYAERIAHCAAEAPERVAAHAYVRFLGDLNGGRVVQRLLAESLAFAPAALTAYDFPAIDDLERFRGEYRRAFDAAAETSEERAAILDEAVLAFRLEIDLANAVAEAAHG
jgi:heme oxygenase (biliverdin-producing, ferredoxin)